MKSLLLVPVTAIGLMIGGSQAKAVDVACLFPTGDTEHPCASTSMPFGDTEPSPVQLIKDTKRTGVRSATCDFNLAAGSGVPNFGKCPAETGEAPAEVINADKAAWDHAEQTYNRVRNDGGCNADFIPYDIAAYCYNYMTNGQLGGAIGASTGGSD